MINRERVLAEWRGIDLKLVEHPRGILIQQGDHEYLALDWKMTPAVRAFIDEAVSKGLSTVIRTQHPKPNYRANGVKYIAFSRTPYERWVVTLDQYSPATGTCDGRIRQFTVEQSYRSLLEAAGVPYRQERGGGKNLYVAFEHISEVLAATTAFIDDVESALGARDWNRVKDEIGFVTEALLESALVATWHSISAFGELELIGNQIDHMDILARHQPTGALVVFELKRSLAGLLVLDQLRGYMLGPARRHADGHPVWGAILATDYTVELAEAVARDSHPVALFTFRGTPAAIEVVSGGASWPSEGPIRTEYGTSDH